MPSLQIERARHLRRNLSRVELRVWLRLRGRQLRAKFRRQHPIGPYIADFACPSAHLVVELDGDTHQNEAYDIHRDKWMESRGWTVLRFALQEVDENLDSVIEAIYSRVNPQQLG